MTVTVDGALGITTPAINISSVGVIQLSGTSDLGISVVDPLTNEIQFDALSYTFNGTGLGKTAYFVNTSTDANPYRGLIAMFLNNTGPTNRVFDFFCDTANQTATIDTYTWKWYLGFAGAGGQGLLSSVANVLTYSGNSLVLTSATAGGTLTLQATGATAQTLKFPSTTGAAGNVLTTDGAGNLSWAVAPATPVNSVQYNKASAFGGSSNFTFNDATNTLTVGTGTINSDQFQVMDTGTPVGTLSYSANYPPITAPALVLDLQSSNDSFVVNNAPLIVSAPNLGKTAFFVNTSTDANPYRGLISMFLNNTGPANSVFDFYCDTSTQNSYIETFTWKWSIGSSGAGGQGRLYVQGGALYFQGGSGTVTMIAPA
jgi:hypothetical protein